VDGLHTGTNSLGSTSTAIKSPPRDSRALVAERPDISPEIPETPAVAFEDMRREEDHNGRTQTIAGASMVTGGGGLEVDNGSSFVGDRLHHEHDTGPMGTDDLQRTDQTEPIVSNTDSDEASLSRSLNLPSRLSRQWPFRHLRSVRTV